MDDTNRKVIGLILFLFAAAVLALIPAVLSGCGAKANAINIESMPGPNGTTCYILKQDGQPFAGNCN